MLIGETLYEGKGKMIINRMIDGGDGIAPPKIEISLIGEGICKGIPVSELWTFIAIINEDGSAFGDGQGIVFTKDRDNREIVTGIIRGIGKSSTLDDNISKSQCIIFYKSKNPKARGTLNFLNNVVGMNRIETNEDTLEYKSNVRQWVLPPSSPSSSPSTTKPQ